MSQEYSTQAFGGSSNTQNTLDLHRNRADVAPNAFQEYSVQTTSPSSFLPVAAVTPLVPLDNTQGNTSNTQLPDDFFINYGAILNQPMGAWNTLNGFRDTINGLAGINNHYGTMNYGDVNNNSPNFSSLDGFPDTFNAHNGGIQQYSGFAGLNSVNFHEFTTFGKHIGSHIIS